MTTATKLCWEFTCEKLIREADFYARFYYAGWSNFKLEWWTIFHLTNTRETLYQIGMRVISLCRGCHTEAHTKGREWLTNTMHLQPIVLTIEIGKVYKLTKKNLEIVG